MVYEIDGEAALRRHRVDGADGRESLYRSLENANRVEERPAEDMVYLRSRDGRVYAFTAGNEPAQEHRDRDGLTIISAAEAWDE